MLRHRPGRVGGWAGRVAALRADLTTALIAASRTVIDDHFSDIDIAAFVQPVEGFAVRTLTSWNVGSNKVSGANASMRWRAFCNMCAASSVGIAF